MAHDIFISYSNKDKLAANAVCAALEAEKVRCWIAPRDVLPGQEWGEAIIDAISSCRIMILIFSYSSNMSKQVQKEVERAINKGIYVIPLRIEEVDPTKSMEYFLSSTHWLDAITPPLEQHIEHLKEIILKFLGTSKVEKAKNSPQVIDSISISDVPSVTNANEEDLLWKEACNKDVMEAYLEYLEKSESRAHEKEALNKLREVNIKDIDRKVWAKATEINTTLSYLDYLNGDTLKMYKNEAIGRLKMLKAIEDTASTIDARFNDDSIDCNISKPVNESYGPAKTNKLFISGIIIYIISAAIMLIGGFTDEGIVVVGMFVSILGAIAVNAHCVIKYNDSKRKKLKGSIKYIVIGLILILLEAAMFLGFMFG